MVSVKKKSGGHLAGGCKPYLFLLPFVLSFLLFFVVPAVYSIFLSFTKYPGYGAYKWVGLQNYKNLLSYPRFWAAFGRTVFYWLAHFVPVTVISFLLAVCIRTKTVSRASKVVKPILFIPQICAVTATALVFQILFAGKTGTINQLFGTSIAWLENAAYTKWVVVLLLIWRSVGWFMVVYLSGLTSVPDDVLEAARIDGASAWQSMIRVTIPILKPTFLFAFLMDAISSWRMYTEIAVLTATEVGNISREGAEGVINLMIINLRSGSFGMASAYGWILFLITFMISMFMLRLFRNKESA